MHTYIYTCMPTCQTLVSRALDLTSLILLCLKNTWFLHKSDKCWLFFSDTAIFEHDRLKEKLPAGWRFTKSWAHGTRKWPLVWLAPHNGRIVASSSKTYLQRVHQHWIPFVPSPLYSICVNIVGAPPNIIPSGNSQFTYSKSLYLYFKDIDTHETFEKDCKFKESTIFDPVRGSKQTFNLILQCHSVQNIAPKWTQFFLSPRQNVKHDVP